MAPVHTQAEIRKVCEDLYDTKGRSAVTRTAVEKILKARAEGRGLEPTAGDHRTVSNIIAAVKAERDAATASAQAASNGLEDFPLPDGLEPALEQIRGIYRRAMSEEARRNESATQVRIKQAEEQTADQVAALSAEIEALKLDATAQADQLDATEMALDTARNSLASIAAANTARTDTLDARDRATREQLSVAQESAQDAMAAALDAEQRAQASELARMKTLGELEFAVERIKRLEADLADARSRAAAEEARAREASQERDIAHGRLTSLEAECAWLRRVAPFAETHRSREEEAVPADLTTGRAK